VSNSKLDEIFHTRVLGEDESREKNYFNGQLLWQLLSIMCYFYIMIASVVVFEIASSFCSHASTRNIDSEQQNPIRRICVFSK
jgi:hypothetical protein